MKPLDCGYHEISFRGDVTRTVDNATADSFAFASGWNYIQLISCNQIIKN